MNVTRRNFFAAFYRLFFFMHTHQQSVSLYKNDFKKRQKKTSEFPQRNEHQAAKSGEKCQFIYSYNTCRFLLCVILERFFISFLCLNTLYIIYL